MSELPDDIALQPIDRVWGFVFAGVEVLAMSGGLFLALILAQPWVDACAGHPADALHTAVEIAVLISGGAFGFLMAVLPLRVMQRRWAPVEARRRWRAQFEHSLTLTVRPLRGVFRLFYRVVFVQD